MTMRASTSFGIGEQLEVRIRKDGNRTEYVRGHVLEFVENGDEIMVSVGVNGVCRFDLVLPTNRTVMETA